MHDYYATVRIGRITGLARLSVCLAVYLHVCLSGCLSIYMSVCLSVRSVPAPNLKTKDVKRNEANVPQNKSNRRANFELRRSKVRRIAA